MRRLLFALLAGTALVCPQPAQAEPISIAILSALAIEATVTAVAITTTLLTVGLSVGLSLASNLLQPGAAATGRPASGITLATSYGGAQPRAAVIGTQTVGGHLVYSNIYRLSAPGMDIDGREVLQAVYVIGDGRHDGMVGLQVNGKTATLHPDTGQWSIRGQTVAELAVGGIPRFFVRFFAGDWDQAADQELIDHANPSGRWTADHRGRGVCYVSITQVCEESNGLTGYPDLVFTMNGLRLYDPRKDSTNGGDGAHRFGDPATWEFSTNPAIAEYHLRRGLYLNGQLMLGMGVAAGDLIVPMYVAAANANDEAVPLLEGGTEPRYRVGMVVAADRTHAEWLQILRTAMAGDCLERAGKFGPLSGVAQVPSFAFSDDDFRVGAKRSFAKHRSRSDIATAIYGRYTEPAQKWGQIAFPPRESVADDEAMGERIGRDVDLSQITSASQAQRVAEILRRKSMLQRHGTAPLGAGFIDVQPGDWGIYTSAKHGTITVKVTGTRLLAEHAIDIVWEEAASSIYSWTTAGELDPTGGVTPLQPATRIDVVPGFAVEGFSQNGANGLVIPGIRATWTPIADRTVDRVIVEYRVDGTTDALRFVAPFPTFGEAAITAGVQAATPYECRAGIETTPLRPTEWTSWLPVTSGADHVVPTAKSVVAGGVDIVALSDQVTTLLDSGQQGHDLAVALRQSASTVANLRNLARLTGLIEDTSWYDLVDSVGQTALRLAFQAENVEQMLAEVGVEQGEGRWTLRGVDKTQGDVRTAQIQLDAQKALIELSATRVELNDAIAIAAAGMQPVVTWAWNSSVEGWTVSGGTLTAGAGYLDFAATADGAYMQSPALPAFDPVDYPVVRFTTRRTGGTGWGVSLWWGASYEYDRAFTVPADPTVDHEAAVDLSNEESWSGTISAIRVTVANGTTIRFSLGQIGKNPLAALLLANVQGEIDAANLRIDGAEASISAKASQILVDEQIARLSTAEQTISGQGAAITQRALITTLDAAVTRLTAAEANINALTGTISFTIQQTQGPSPLQIAGVGAINDVLNQESARAETHELAARAHTEWNTRITQTGEVIAQELTKLQVQADDAKAEITEEKIVRAGADFAEASARLTLAADLSTETQSRIAAVTSEATARANADSAEASARQTVAADLSTETQNRIAAVTSEATARANADSAEASARQTVAADLSTETQNRIAAVSSEASARATADSSEATARQQVAVDLSTETQNRIAAVTTVSNAVGTVDGRLAASWLLTVNAGNQIAGIRAYADGATNSLTFVSDNVFFAFPGQAGGDPVNVFALRNVNGVLKVAFRGDMYADGDIISRHLSTGTLLTNSAQIAGNLLVTGHAQGAAFTQLTSAAGSNGNATLNNEEREIHSVGFTADVGNVSIDAAAYLDQTNSVGPPSCYLRIYIDGVKKGESKAIGKLYDVNGSAKTWAIVDTIPVFAKELVAPGAHTVSLRLYYPGTSPLQWFWESPFIKILEAKK